MGRRRRLEVCHAPMCVIRQGREWRAPSTEGVRGGEVVGRKEGDGIAPWGDRETQIDWVAEAGAWFQSRKAGSLGWSGVAKIQVWMTGGRGGCSPRTKGHAGTVRVRGFGLISNAVSGEVRNAAQRGVHRLYSSD